jgi:hypothetical protein
MGSLATAETWARYEVPASLLALEGRTVARIDPNSWNGHVYFDHRNESRSVFKERRSQSRRSYREIDKRR